jgi:DNA processing protein
MISENTESLLAYRYLKGIGKKYLNEIAIASELSGGQVKDYFLLNRNANYSKDEMEFAFNKAREQVELANKLGHMIVSRLDKSYPKILKVILDPPPILFCAGNIDLLSKDIITIIGTRNPTEHGSSIADRVTQWFSEEGWVVASGLAKGIDTIVHQSCLNVGGSTISILAHGLEKIYPAQNKQLAQNILDNDGLLISEYGYNSYVGKANFVERDRVQAALAKAVVLVQSDLIGGSLHASRASLDYDRFLIVLGQSIRDISNREEKISANMLLIEGNLSEKIAMLKTNQERLSNILYVPDKTYLKDVSNKVKALEITTKNLKKDINISLF